MKELAALIGHDLLMYLIGAGFVAFVLLAAIVVTYIWFKLNPLPGEKKNDE